MASKKPFRKPQTVIVEKIIIIWPLYEVRNKRMFLFISFNHVIRAT